MSGRFVGLVGGADALGVRQERDLRRGARVTSRSSRAARTTSRALDNATITAVAARQLAGPLPADARGTGCCGRSSSASTARRSRSRRAARRGPAPRPPLAGLLSGRRLDRHRPAGDDRKRRRQRPPGGGGRSLAAGLDVVTIRSTRHDVVSSVIVHYQELALKGRNRPWFITRSCARSARRWRTSTSRRAGRSWAASRCGSGPDARVAGRARAAGRACRASATSRARRTSRPTSTRSRPASSPGSRAVPPSRSASPRGAPTSGFPIPSPEIEREIGRRVQEAHGLAGQSRRSPSCTIHVEVADERRVLLLRQGARRRRAAGRHERHGDVPALGRHRFAGGGVADDAARLPRALRPLPQLSDPVARRRRTRCASSSQPLTRHQLRVAAVPRAVRRDPAAGRPRRAAAAARRHLPPADDAHRRAARAPARRAGARDRRRRRPGRVADDRESGGDRRRRRRCRCCGRWSASTRKRSRSRRSASAPTRSRSFPTRTAARCSRRGIRRRGAAATRSKRAEAAARRRRRSSTQAVGGSRRGGLQIPDGKIDRVRQTRRCRETTT